MSEELERQKQHYQNYLERRRRWRHGRYQRDKAAGICVSAGCHESAVPGKTHCTACAIRAHNNTKRYAARQRELKAAKQIDTQFDLFEVVYDPLEI